MRALLEQTDRYRAGQRLGSWRCWPDPENPQAHRVERILVVAGDTVRLEMRPVGLAADAPVRVTLAWHAMVERLGSIED